MTSKRPASTRHSATLAFTATLLLGAWRIFADGLPGEYLTSGAWRAVGSGSSPLTNPALILERSWLQARFTGSSLSGDYTMGDLGISLPLTMHQSLGLSWLYQSAGEYDQKEFNSSDFSQTTLGTMEDRNNVFTVTYALSPRKWLGLGANLNVVYNQFNGQKTSAVGADGGLTLRLPEHRVLGRHVLGVAMQNAVTPVIASAFSRTLNVSWSGSYARRYVSTLVSWQLRDIGTGSAEGAQNLPWGLDGKLGVWPFKVASLYGLLGLDSDGFDYFGGALGVNLPMANRGRDLEACYQYVALANNQSLHSVYVQGEFGWNRDEVNARLEERRRDALPRQLFERALEMFDQGRFWEAFFTFGRIKADHPRFNRLDAVDYYAARCLEELDMRQAASANFELARRTYPGSRFVSDIQLGLARVQYRERSIAELENTYRDLLASQAPDSLVHHARYLLGQAVLGAGQYARARSLLDSIPPSHPEFPYAQFSAAMADLTLDWPREMERRMMTVALTVQSTPALREIAARANLKLGLLYLEDLANDPQSLARAVTALRRVPVDTKAYPDALTALAWAGMDAANWPDCITIGRTLLSLRGADPRMRAEGALVAGYALFTIRDYIAALDVLEEGAQLIENYTPSVPRTAQIARATYNDIGQSVSRLALQKESPERLAVISALRRRQTDLKQQLDAIALESTLTQTDFCLRRRSTDLKTDLLFVLAEASRKASSEKAVEYQLRMQRRMNQYDQKIEQLKQEIKSEK